MEDHAHDNLKDLLRQFFNAADAEMADADIRTGERLLGEYPAPMPERETILRIKKQVAATVWRRRRIAQTLRRSVAVAAVVAFALLGVLSRGPTSRTDMFHAAIIPAAIWDSDNIAAADVDLVYFTGEVRQIESQLQALNAADDEAAGVTVEDLETELIQIETELSKG